LTPGRTHIAARRSRAKWIGPLAGVAASLLLAECALRFVATGATLSGLPTGETYRQYSEGIATSHFNDDTSRATGNEFLPGAPTIVILGDSHVPAVQIEDTATMGSVLERLARSHGMPLNVRQFGWSGLGYGIARSLALGPGLAATYDAQKVVVVLSEGALRTYPADRAAAARLGAELPPSVRNLSTLERLARQVAHYSVLVHLLYVRLQEALLAARVERTSPEARAACVRTDDDARREIVADFKRTFGDRLLLLYAPEVGVDSSEDPDCWERLMLPQCRELGVLCISLRDAMLDAKHSYVLARGFANTLPGTGHLNRVGHELAARTLFEAIASSPGSRD